LLKNDSKGVPSFNMVRNGIGLNRKDGRTNLVIPALDDKMIYSILLREVDATN